MTKKGDRYGPLKNLRGSKKRKFYYKFSVSLLQDRIVKDMVAFLQEILSVCLV